MLYTTNNFFWLLMRALYLKYNILVRSLETTHVSYLYDCQSLSFALNSNSIPPAVDDSVRSLGINRKSYLFDPGKYVVYIWSGFVFNQYSRCQQSG